jgi:ABC-type polysaccharide/polyol phosphate export permease
VPIRREVLGVDVPVRFIYRLNPLVRFIEAFRDLLYNLRAPNLVTMLYLVAWAGGTLFLGLKIFARLEPRLAEEV